MPPLSQLLHWPARLFFLKEDERIYAMVRMGFAAIALVNLMYLWPEREVFFSDSGLVDAEAARSLANPIYLSVFALARSDAAVTGVMLVSAFALLMLLAGVGARLAAAWVLVWHVSYMARSPLPLVGWDLVLRCFSFLVLVSPLGRCWSLPALWRGGKWTVPTHVSSHGLVLMRLQVLVLYWQAVLARVLHPDPYWKNGEFLSYYMLSHHSRWPGAWVLGYGGLMTLGSYAIQVAEPAIPVLLWVKKTRWWGGLVGIGLHAGISLCTQDLGMFGLSMVMTYLAFLRREDVDALGRLAGRWRKQDEPTV